MFLLRSELVVCTLAAVLKMCCPSPQKAWQQRRKPVVEILRELLKSKKSTVSSADLSGTSCDLCFLHYSFSVYL